MQGCSRISMGWKCARDDEEGTNSSFAMSRLNSLCSADSEAARARLAASVSSFDSWPNILLLTAFMWSMQ